MKNAIIISAVVAGLAVAPAFAADNAPPTPNSGPGIQGAAGNKNGPAAKSVKQNKMDQAGSSGASAGTSGKGVIDPTTQPSQDSTGVKGAPGNKSGPSAKKPTAN